MLRVGIHVLYHSLSYLLELIAIVIELIAASSVRYNGIIQVNFCYIVIICFFYFFFLKDRANEIYKKVEDLKSIRGRNQDAILAACLYIACRQEDRPRTVKGTYCSAQFWIFWTFGFITMHAFNSIFLFCVVLYCCRNMFCC